MTRISFGLILTSIVTTCLMLVGPARAADQTITGHAILRLEDDILIEDVVATYNAEVLDVLFGASRPSYLIELPPTLSDQDFLVMAETDVRIKDAEIDVTAAVPDPGTQSFFIPSAAIRFANQPTRGRAELNGDIGIGAGAGTPPPMIVAVIDTGLDTTHPYFAGRIAPNGVSLLFGDPSIEDIGDNQDNDGDGVADELVGHGTMVASAVLYASPNAQVLPIRAVDSDGRSTAFRVAKGVTEAIARGADVVNISLGSTLITNVIENAIEDATEAGIPVIASAGNDGAELLRYPAASLGVISIAGTGAGDVHAGFTTYGPHIALSAPAVDFVGAYPGGTWAKSSGTSFAAPLVSGLVASLRAGDPLATPAQIQTVLTSTAEPIDAMNPGFEGQLGAGRVDVESALAMIGLPAPYLVGDLDLSGAVDVADLNRVLSLWATGDSIGDADYDGVVDINDLNVILSAWGTP